MSEDVSALLSGELKTLGLSAAQADVYVSLEVDGPATAVQVASRLGISRQGAHRHAEALVGKGFASITPSRPKRYLSVPLDSLLRAEAARRAARGAGLKGVLARLEQLGDSPAAAADDSLQVIVGRESTYVRLSEMLRTAKKSVLAVSLYEQAPRIAQQYGIWDIMESRPDLDFQVILPDVQDTISLWGQLDLAGHVQLRLAAARPMRFVIVDGKEILIVASMDESAGPRAADKAIWANSEGLISHYRLLFSAMWADSEDVGEADAVLGDGSSR